MPRKYVPPRIRALLARESPQALLICRCRSRLMAIVGWDRGTDRFTIGQWMKGRIESGQADISPDGRHWIYSAYDPSNDSYAQRRERWTAIARVPFLKALCFEFCGGPGGAHGGGGVFLDNRTYYAYGDATLQPQMPGVDFERGGNPLKAGENFRSFHLQRDGWRCELRPADRTPEELEMLRLAHARSRELLQKLAIEKPSLFRVDAQEIWARPFEPPTERYFLRTLPHGWNLEIGQSNAPYSESYRLIHESGQVITRPSWLWADWDSIRGRLVWAEDGFIRAAAISGDRIEPAQDLFDANLLRFERLAAPY